MIPNNTAIWSQELDPANELDFTFDVADLLQPLEVVSSCDIEVTADAASSGLVLGTGAQAPAQVTATSWRIWLSIDPAMRDVIIFNDKGTVLTLTVTITTDSVPARVLRRFVGVRVVNSGG
jgi:hypothetical protein